MPSNTLASDLVLVVSGLGAGGVPGGGVYRVDDCGVALLDRRPTSGLMFNEKSRNWLRALSGRDRGQADCQILEIGPGHGSPNERLLGTVLDAHDVGVVGGNNVAVATFENAIAVLDGESSRHLIRLPGEMDSWHLNCLEVVGEELFASAFCRGSSYGQWRQERDGGIVFSLTHGQVVVDGLSAPHTPRFVDDLWLVCNSLGQEVLAVDPADPTGRVRSIDVGGFSRGLAVADDVLYVGVSARRHDVGDAAESSVVVVDRSTWTVLERVIVPSPEIYDCCLVPREAAELLVGDTEPIARDRPFPVDDLDPAAFSLQGVLPKRISRGEFAYLPARLRYTSVSGLETTGTYAMGAAL